MSKADFTVREIYYFITLNSKGTGFLPQGFQKLTQRQKTGYHDGLSKTTKEKT